MAIPKFIQATDFIADINLQISNENLSHVNDILAKAEKECLRKILGDALWNELDKAMVLNEVTELYEINEETYPELYKLVYGDFTFTNINGILEKYEGILDFIRYYSFWFYVKDNQSHQTSIGSAKLAPEGSNLLSDKQNLEEANKRFDKSLWWYYQIWRYIDKYFDLLFVGDISGQYAYWCPPRLRCLNGIKNESIL